MRASSDGREYFVQVRSLAIDWDLDFENENAHFGVRGKASLYPFGAAILWLPFFLLAHLWLGVLNLLGGDYPRNGFFNPYQRAVGLGTLIYGFAGLVLIYRILRDYFSKSISALTIISVCAGSFLIWYLAVESSMVHGVSLFATTLFLYLWHQTRTDRSTRQWALLGASAGLMAMVRWQNVLFLVFPVAEAVGQYTREFRGESWSHLKNLAREHCAFVACGILAFLPQFYFWARVRGGWFRIPAWEHGVSWLPVAAGEVLFSADHGLFSWTPLLYFAVLGIPFFFRRDRLLATLLIVAFLGQVYINSAVGSWSGGSGFGARRFANCALIFAIGLASLLEWLKRRPFVAPFFLLVSLIAVNVSFMLDLKSGNLPSGEAVSFDRISEAFYSRLGNPFSFPMNAYVAWQYGANLSSYDRWGRTYNNVRIDFGEENDDRFLVQGWSHREMEPRLSFRWANADESSLVVSLKEIADYKLEFRCQPFTFPAAPPQVVEVLVNGRSVDRILLHPGFHDYEVAIPKRFIRKRLNEIRFRYQYAVSPSEAGVSNDRRVLAVRFDTLQLIRGS